MDFDPLLGASPKILADRLSSGHLYLAPYFEALCSSSSTEIPDAMVVQCRPLLQALDFAGQSITEVKNVSPKLFRQTCIRTHSSVLPELMQNIQSRNWFSFWNMALLAVQRNVIYRLLAGSIPHRSLMCRFFPDKFLSPICQVCSENVPDSTENSSIATPRPLFGKK
jgi:hypothetical protein